MKVQHRLTETEAAFFAEARRAVGEYRTEYLAALGLVKEAEMRSASVQTNMEQQTRLIVRAAGLPDGLYKLSADGLALEAEAADVPATPEVPSGLTAAAGVNGSVQHGG